ncbi:hypothetical protein FBY06_1306 [Pseudomonas sp. SJZ085]|nr:hypothetical protein FBX99_102380 [Pseudomonas sp. SJZ074]TWC31986.1 hypothetical protein FBY06_1306 [Pseudomonas sp. SJZ085]
MVKAIKLADWFGHGLMQKLDYAMHIVGAGLLAKASDQSAYLQTAPPLSRASPLPQRFAASSRYKGCFQANEYTFPGAGG